MIENFGRNAKHSQPCIQVITGENILMHLNPASICGKCCAQEMCSLSLPKVSVCSNSHRYWQYMGHYGQPISYGLNDIGYIIWGGVRDTHRFWYQIDYTYHASIPLNGQFQRLFRWKMTRTVWFWFIFSTKFCLQMAKSCSILQMKLHQEM